MKLKDIGERELIRLAKEIYTKGPSVKIGIGDDAAAIDAGEEYLVLTSDMLVEATHFLPKTPMKQVGRKAVVANLSDIAAMGAEPLGLIFSIGAPPETEEDLIENLLRSLDKNAKKYGTYVVGGDLNESNVILVSGMGVGRVPKSQILTRSGAEVGNLIAVTGKLGAAAGAKIVLEGLESKGYEGLIKFFTEPEARVEVGRIISESGASTSAIDITDGLAANLWQISRMSGVGVCIVEEKLPIHPLVKKFVEERHLDQDDFVLYGGEEYEILFTVKRDRWEDLKGKIQEKGVIATSIGEIKATEGVKIERDGILEELLARGYEHFR